MNIEYQKMNIPHKFRSKYWQEGGRASSKNTLIETIKKYSGSGNDDNTGNNSGGNSTYTDYQLDQMFANLDTSINLIMSDLDSSIGDKLATIINNIDTSINRKFQEVDSSIIDIRDNEITSLNSRIDNLGDTYVTQAWVIENYAKIQDPDGQTVDMSTYATKNWVEANYKKVVCLTRTEYDALATKDLQTLYLIS